PVQRPEIRNNRESHQSTDRSMEPQPQTMVESTIGDQTMMNLERLRGASADKDKTFFERTVVYLENLQASLPWWQKLLFGLLTIAVILGLSFWGLASLWSLITETGPKETSNEQQTQLVMMKDFEKMNVEDAKEWLTSKGF